MRRLALPVCAVGLLLAAVGCARDASNPTASLPAGVVVLGHSSALERFFAEVARIDGTPIAAFAADARERAASCAGRAAVVLPSGDVADESSRRWLCGSDALPEVFSDLRPDEIVVVMPGVGRRSYARIGVGRASAGHEVSVIVAREEPTLLALLAPSDQEARADRLPREGAILHAHVASAGVIPLPEGASTEFRTGARALFDGSWEAALLSPEAGETTPAFVVALGLRSVELGAKALSTVAELGAQPFGGRTRVVRLDGGIEAKCLAERAIVLGFAPCAAVHRGALIAGWHERALHRVLAHDAVTKSRGITIDFDAMATADSILAAAAPAASIPTPRMPWRRLVLEASAPGVLAGVLEVRP